MKFMYVISSYNNIVQPSWFSKTLVRENQENPYLHQRYSRKLQPQLATHLMSCKASLILFLFKKENLVVFQPLNPMPP